MRCKAVTALPAGEKWAFEIKLDGYRCIAVKRGKEVTLFWRHEKVPSKRFPGVVQAIASLDGDSFSTQNLSPWIHEVNLHFSFCNTTFRSRFLLIVTPSIYSSKMANCS